jgi:hypothetical protein
MKLQDGENKIRILSAPLLGWEDWLDKKPMRYKMDNKPLKSHDPLKPIKHFWAFIVWNYAEEKIQILQITQASVRSRIEDLCKDEDWGQPFFFDIKILKKGQDLKTEYTVNPMPHKPLAPHIKQEFIDKPIYLDALFSNADPFDTKWGEYTPGIFGKEEVVKETLKTIVNVKVEDYINSFGDDKDLMREYVASVSEFNEVNPATTIAKFKQDDEATERDFKAWKEMQVPF